jgi:16S rRNA G966 N2-methylase RsmD
MLVRINHRSRKRVLTHHDRVDIVEHYCEEGLSIGRIEVVTGWKADTIRRVLVESGVEIIARNVLNGEGATAEERDILAKAKAIRARVKNRKRALNIVERVQASTNLPPIGDRFELYKCPLVDAPIGGETIDTIITDPPYMEQYLYVYRDLSRMGYKWLKPGGSMFVMVGQFHFPAVLDAILRSSPIEYFWLMNYSMGAGGSNQVRGRNITNVWKPILWLQKGRYKGKMISDMVRSGYDSLGSDNHKWGQSLSGFVNLVKATTKVGDVICDPFVGGGTTGVAAIKTNRKFVGVDVSRRAIETTKSRIWELVRTS